MGDEPFFEYEYPPRQRDSGIPFAEPEDRSPELIESLIKSSSSVLVKKLALNDRQWAIWDPNKIRKNGRRGDWKSHQGGPLLPAEARISGFFPPMRALDSTKPKNLTANLDVYWPTTGKYYESTFRWWGDSKTSAENHLTVNPYSEFSGLSPASFLLIFKPREAVTKYRALTIDAADDDLIDYVRDVFGIGPDFNFHIFDSTSLRPRSAILAVTDIVEELLVQLRHGPDALQKHVQTLRKRSPADIALEAQKEFLRGTEYGDLSPYRLPCPGDILHELTREIEFSIFKRDEARFYGAHLVQVLLGSDERKSPTDLARFLVERFDVVYDICLSAKQARSSRAGGSFESHMAKMLGDGNIPNAAQSVLDGNRPDFVLPSERVYKNTSHRADDSLVLTLKTTLRERWKQVVTESAGCPIYLATLDESVPSSTLDKLEAKEIILLVPERFQESDFCEYAGRRLVKSYRQFFDELRADYGPRWRSKRIRCFN